MIYFKTILYTIKCISSNHPRGEIQRGAERGEPGLLHNISSVHSSLFELTEEYLFIYFLENYALNCLILTYRRIALLFFQVISLSVLTRWNMSHM